LSDAPSRRSPWGVGVIDIKDNETETSTEIARCIERAVKVLGAERIKWVHPDCGFWMVFRSVADAKCEPSWKEGTCIVDRSRRKASFDK
jgi:methionine synthase II (cobalamin-independent)